MAEADRRRCRPAEAAPRERSRSRPTRSRSSTTTPARSRALVERARAARSACPTTSTSTSRSTRPIARSATRTSDVGRRPVVLVDRRAATSRTPSGPRQFDAGAARRRPRPSAVRGPRTASTRDFADAPPDDELTLPQRAAWDALRASAGSAGSGYRRPAASAGCTTSATGTASPTSPTPRSTGCWDRPTTSRGPTSGRSATRPAPPTGGPRQGPRRPPPPEVRPTVVGDSSGAVEQVVGGDRVVEVDRAARRERLGSASRHVAP